MIAENHRITFNPNIEVDMKNYDGQISRVSLQSGLIWMQGFILNYFNSNSLIFNQTDLMFYNYYTSIYPAISKFTLAVDASNKSTIIIFAVLMFISLVIVILWSYYIMAIDRKCSDIILWFLDIPLPYITHLQTNCISFIKNHTPVR